MSAISAGQDDWDLLEAIEEHFDIKPTDASPTDEESSRKFYNLGPNELLFSPERFVSPKW